MNFIHAILLGIIEGLTEFLPVSSTGHILILSDILKITASSFASLFSIVIQSGAILAVITLFFKRFFERAILKSLIIAIIPTGILGFLLHDFVVANLQNSLSVIFWALLIGGILMIIIENKINPSTSSEQEDSPQENPDTVPTNKQAFWVGLAQVIAFIPGVSRSYASILAGRLSGMSKENSIIFSFLLAVPTIIGASVLDISSFNRSFSKEEIISLIIGIKVSFVVAVFVIKGFMKIIKKIPLKYFGYYRILVGTTGLLILFF